MQTSVTIHIYQGERPMAADNVSLGEFNLDGIPPAPRNLPKIDVTFDIDTNGILNVSAQDLATGRSQSIRIAGSTRLPHEEKARMVQEAERYAEQDKKRREEAERLNNADSVCYQAEKTLADYGAKIAEDLRKRIDSALRETKEAVKKRDAALATECAEKLKVVLQEVGKKLYEEAAPKGPQPSPDVGAKGGEARPSGSGPRGRVVEAEFKESK
jgi:molecular chaperone DnaK